MGFGNEFSITFAGNVTIEMNVTDKEDKDLQKMMAGLRVAGDLMVRAPLFAVPVAIVFGLISWCFAKLLMDVIKPLILGA